MTSKSDQAAKYFRGPEGYNCVQAVIKAYEDDFTIAEVVFEEFKKYGGGRAPDNICGALYASLYLLSNDNHAKGKITKDFEQEAGNIRCLDIRKEGKTPCRECVKIAAKFLENYQK